MDSSGDWRTTNKGGIARAGYLLSSGQWSDCEFLVGKPPSQELVAAHKLHLASSSPVFEAMFFGSIPVENGPVQVPDIEAKTFRAMLEFIYTDELSSLHVDLALDLFYCAKKYLLPDLVETCTDYLLSNITAQNVCEIYRLASLFEKPKLVDKCLEFMCTETKKVLTSTSWGDADEATISVLFGQKHLTIDSELDLYEALLVWSRAECVRKSLAADKKSLRSVAGDLLRKIRFLALTPEEFTHGPVEGEILEQDEIIAIFKSKFSGDSGTSIPEGFSIEKTPRVKSGKQKGGVHATNLFVLASITAKFPKPLDEASEFYCYRDVLTQSQPILRSPPTESRLSFRVDASIEIVGVLVPSQVCSGFENIGRTYPEKLSVILLCDSEPDMYVVSIYAGETPYNKILVMRFDCPITVETHTDYRIIVTFFVRGRYPNENISQSATCEQVGFAFYHEYHNYNERDQLIRGIVFVKKI